MRSLAHRWFRAAALVALVLSVLLPAIASADSSGPPDFEGTGTMGQDPADALAIVGVARNTLVPGQSVWYQVSYADPPPLAVTVNYYPTNAPPAGSVQMHVDWATPTGTRNADWPGYYRIADGTSSGFSQGTLYWQTSDDVTASYLIEIVNNSMGPVGYAIAVTGHQFPPPALSPPAPSGPIFP